jgi:excisionase family DNA binding protein
MTAETEHLTLVEAAERLGVHYMTVYRYVRTGRLRGEKLGQHWRVPRAEIDRLLADPGLLTVAERVDPAQRTRRAGYPLQLTERLLVGDEPGAWTLIQGALAAGMDAEHIYLDLIAPALRTIGDRWALGLVSVADEHLASGIVARLIGRLGPAFARRGRKRGTIVLGTPPREAHALPTALLGDLLRGRGFEVVDLGADVPAESWREAADRERLVAIGVCATSPGNEAAIEATTGAIRRETEVPIVLGGLAVGAADPPGEAFGATEISQSFEHALDLLDRAVPTPRTGDA